MPDKGASARRRHRSVYPLVGALSTGALLIAFVVACSTGPDSGAADTDGTPQSSATPVALAAVDRGSFVAELRGNTTLRSKVEVTVTAEIAGTLRTLSVDVGDEVRRGQRIGSVANLDSRSAVREAEQHVARMRTEVDSLRPLIERGYVARSTFDEAVFQLELAETRFDRARSAASYQSVRAPADGVISARHVAAGETVAPGAPIVEIIDPLQLEARIAVPERELARLQVGTPAEVVATAFEGAVYAGSVSSIDPTVDPNTGTVAVRIQIENAAGDEGAPSQSPSLRPGMFVEAGIELGRREDRPRVPSRAVLAAGNERRVFVVEESEGALVARRREIAIGAVQGVYTEIISGVQVGEEVVVVGQDRLSDGEEVRRVDGSGSDEREAVE